MKGTAVHSPDARFPLTPRRAQGHLRALTLTLLLVVSWLWASEARAAMMPHHDLCSLAFASTAIVRAERLGERKVDEYTTLVAHRVSKVFFGGLRPGDVVEVDYGALMLDDPFQREPEGSLSKEVILFLSPARPSTEAGSPAATWNLAPSGLRILREGKVMRFEQFSNPGPYAPVPQGIDPFDIAGDPRGTRDLTFEDLEPMITRAVEQAKQAHLLIDRAAAEPTSNNLEALVDLIAPERPADDEVPAFVQGGFSFFADLVASEALRTLQEKAPPEVLASAVARVRGGVSLFGTLRVRDATPFFDLALSSQAAVPLRVAALAILEDGWYNKDDGHFDDFLRLVNDPNAELRAAAVPLRWQRAETQAAAEKALKKRLSIEKDGRVLCALWERLRADGRAVDLGHAGAPPPYLLARKDGLAVALSFCAGGDERWDFKKADLEVRQGDRRGKVVGTLDLAKTVGGWSGAGVGGFVGFIDPSGFSPGEYALSLAVVLDNGKGRTVSRSFELQDLRISGKMPVPAARAQAPVAAPSAVQPNPIVSVPPRAGSCVCTSSVGDHGSPDAWLGAALAGLLAWSRRAGARIS